MSENITGKKRKIEDPAAAVAAVEPEPELIKVDVFLNPIPQSHMGPYYDPVLLFNPMTREYFTSETRQLIGTQNPDDNKKIDLPQNESTTNLRAMVQNYFNNTPVDGLTFVDRGEFVKFYKVYIYVIFNPDLQDFTFGRIGILAKRETKPLVTFYDMCLSINRNLDTTNRNRVPLGVNVMKMCEAPPDISEAYMNYFGIHDASRGHMVADFLDADINARRLDRENRGIQETPRNALTNLGITELLDLNEIGDYGGYQYFGGGRRKRTRRRRKRTSKQKRRSRRFRYKK